jgi:DNA repair exonuclease SbcCD ATPase subunit
MILFKSLTFVNFLSAGNTPTTIELDTTKTTLIHGTNGSGKSLMLDALCYSLFGKPFRPIKLGQLVNTSNKKGLLVEVVFSIGNNEYLVRRGMKPKVFEVWKNEELLDAKAADRDNQSHLEQNILKLNYKSFCQVVILGSASYTPFMKLVPASRRECVEDFLDIKVFSSMAILAKERLRGLRDSLEGLKGDMGNLMYKINLQQDRIQEIDSQQSADTQKIKEDIDTLSQSIDKKLTLINDTKQHEEQVINLLQQVTNHKPNAKRNEMSTFITKFQTQIDRLKKDTEFFDSHDSCPTCRQDITEDVSIGITENNHMKISDLSDAIKKANEESLKYEDDMRIADTRRKHIDSLQQSIYKYEVVMQSMDREMVSLQNRLNDILQNTGSLDREKGKLDILKEDAKDMKHRYDTLTDTVRDHEVVVDLLKDSGIKTQIVRKYLPVMNQCIRKYLNELDFPIFFTLDEEFDETVKSPAYQDYSYSSFSEGQKARIDLSILFAWREVCRLKNSVTTSLLVLDEVFSSSLDEAGKQCLLSLIRYKLEDTHVVVVDHTLSENFKEKFDRTIEVSKVKGFSKYS